ncbi:MAG: hypothetical protein H6618_05550 [Deltaproteobacteria bacterium]|nr:hypothetical protein [Deltaproteobacteria bacterium]
MTGIILAFVLLLLSLSLGFYWSSRIGVVRASLSVLCRILWISPLVLCLFPENGTEELPRALDPEPLYVLIDDSDSMKRLEGFRSPLAYARDIVEDLDKHCRKTGCVLHSQLLSDRSDMVSKGWSPLNEVLEEWLIQTEDAPWILLSDGHDEHPSLSWSDSLRDLGVRKRSSQQGHGEDSAQNIRSRSLILGYGRSTQERNVWLESPELPPFAFGQQSIYSDVLVRMEPPATEPIRVQVQILLNQEILSSDNVEFKAGDQQARIRLPLAALPRGQQLLTFRALPIAGESAIWDNERHKQIEVMPNTVGVLHLLGSPSWDGRFLRRYLKSEPKYDLISFFILRDPWDQQNSNERELSLIPFPVSRLFNEELPNFKVIVLQNFTLLQFLLPEYQENLVRFVKNGGGLLFLGGERSLLSSDIRNSPLREILPFDSGDSSADAEMFPAFSAFPLMGNIQDAQVDMSGPWFDRDLRFRLRLARPPLEKRLLANVYDDWEALAGPLTKLHDLSGLHHMENVRFRSEFTTPLLNAVTQDGREIPLALASYPGKGRAVWIFSDDFWQIAMSENPAIPREIYDRFFASAMTWLLRQDIRKPLLIKDFRLSQREKGQVHWQSVVKGPAVPYLGNMDHWQLSVCDLSLNPADILIRKTGNQEMLLSGDLKRELRGGERCDLRLSGEHPAFGLLELSSATIFPPAFPDSSLDSSPRKLKQLAELTGARLIMNPDHASDEILEWLDQNQHHAGVALPQRYRSYSDYFWIFKTVWIWLFLLFIPLEVLCRRWHLLR